MLRFQFEGKTDVWISQVRRVKYYCKIQNRAKYGPVKAHAIETKWLTIINKTFVIYFLGIGTSNSRATDIFQCCTQAEVCPEVKSDSLDLGSKAIRLGSRVTVIGLDSVSTLLKTISSTKYCYPKFATGLHSILRQDLNKKSKIREMTFLNVLETFGELIYSCKMFMLESRLGSNLTFFSGSDLIIYY